MPSLANITIKKYDGTTDITFTGVAASAGDKSPAIWRSTTVGVAVAHQPEFRVTSRSNGDNSARRIEGALSYPEAVLGTDSIYRIAHRALGGFYFVLPLGMTTTVSREAAYQMGNLMAASLTKAMLETGFAAT